MGIVIFFLSIAILGLFLYNLYIWKKLEKCEVRIRELKEATDILENEKKALKGQLVLEKRKREEEEATHTKICIDLNAKYEKEIEKRKTLQNEVSSLERKLKNQEQNEKHNKDEFIKRLKEEKLKQKELEEKISKLEIIIARKNKEDRILKIEEAKGARLLAMLAMVKEHKERGLENKKKQIQQELYSIGATIKEEKKNDVLGYRYYGYTVTVDEGVVLDRLFLLLENYQKWECYITDLNTKNVLLKVIPSLSEWKICFEQDKEVKVFNKGNYKRQSKDFLFCYLENRKLKRLENNLECILKEGIQQIFQLRKNGKTIEERVHTALKHSRYDITFKKQIECFKDSEMFIVEYDLPNKSEIPNIKEYKYVQSTKEINLKKYSESEMSKRYENTLYAITLRSLYEIFFIDTQKEIKAITFNGYVTTISPSTGTSERNCILSAQVDRIKFSKINLLQVDPKECFKSLKGVAASKLIEISPITPILTFNKNDRRFVEGKNVKTDQGTNLASMHWEDFEQLVRELFELEFAKNGGEVRVTQASRDGGVDAVIFDPDPLRGGKIVIQAKRYTNTVGVSAVRDLYGTVINEGANSGILITTSNYGHDSYDFAKDKPLKLLNGGHLLALLHKNGRKAHINIEEAKKLNLITGTNKS